MALLGTPTVGTSHLPFGRAIRITPHQFNKLLRLFQGRSISEPLVKEDWLVLAAVFRAGICRPFDLLRVQRRLLRWIQFNRCLFDQWLHEIREVHPQFLDILLQAMPRPPLGRRCRTKPTLPAPPPSQPPRPILPHYGPCTGKFPEPNYPLLDHYVPADLKLPEENDGNNEEAWRRPFGAPMLLEPAVNCKPGPGNPLNPPGIEVTNFYSLQTVKLPRLVPAFPERLLPEPKPSTAPRPVPAPTPLHLRLTKLKPAMIVGNLPSAMPPPNRRHAQQPPIPQARSVKARNRRKGHATGVVGSGYGLHGNRRS